MLLKVIYKLYEQTRWNAQRLFSLDQKYTFILFNILLVWGFERLNWNIGVSWTVHFIVTN